MTRQQVIAALILAIALVLCAYGCLLYASASMPYPDPTPELLQEQSEQLRSASFLALSSGAVAASALLWLRRLRRPGH
jgi:cell division protein FtsW (lipid II flippase)